MASSNLSYFHMAPTSEFKGHESIPFKEGDVGIFGFGFLAISFIDFFVFVLKKIRFFGFGVSIGFSFVGHLVSSFRKRYKRFFRCDVLFSLWFSHFPIVNVHFLHGFLIHCTRAHLDFTLF